MKNYECWARLIGMVLAVVCVVAFLSITTAKEPVERIDIPERLVEHTEKKDVARVLEKLDAMVVVAEAEEKEERMLNIEDRIVFACQDYGIPWEIPLAIARLETGWFKSNAYINGNNPGGMSRNEKPIKYDTIEEGVEAFISNLANNYFAIGLDTPEEIGKKYCPVNPEWASLVRQLMEYEYMGG